MFIIPKTALFSVTLLWLDLNPGLGLQVIKVFLYFLDVFQDVYTVPALHGFHKGGLDDSTWCIPFLFSLWNSIIIQFCMQDVRIVATTTLARLEQSFNLRFFKLACVSTAHKNMTKKNIFHLQIEVCCCFWLLSFCHTFVNKQSFFYIVNCHLCQLFLDFSINYKWCGNNNLVQNSEQIGTYLINYVTKFCGLLRIYEL